MQTIQEYSKISKYSGISTYNKNIVISTNIIKYQQRRIYGAINKMLSLWAIGLLGLLNQGSPSSYQSPAQQRSAQFSSSGWGTSPAAQNPWSFNRPMPNTNMPNMNTGSLPGSMPGAMPGSMPGAMPGSMPGAMPGSCLAMPGSMPNAMPGAMPGGTGSGFMAGAMPGAMPNMRSSNNMMGNMRNGYPPSYMTPSPRNTICVAPVSQPRLCMVNGENTHKYRLKDVIEFLGHPNIEKVPKCVPGVPRVNCADYYAAQYIWKRGYCYCKNFHSNLPSYQMGSTQIRCVVGAQWGTGQSFQFTPPTQQPPTQGNNQFAQMNKFFPRPNQTPSWGQSPNPTPQNAWNFRRPITNNMATNVPGNMPGAMPNMRGNLPNSMMNNMRNLMGNMRPGVTPNMPGAPGLGGGYPSTMCYAPPHLPHLCTENGENQHKFTLKVAIRSIAVMCRFPICFPALGTNNSISYNYLYTLSIYGNKRNDIFSVAEVMRMLGDKNIEKISQCVPGVPRVNCANYNSAQYIWKRGYCYCKRYHSNMHAFKKYDPLRCVLNDCGACSQEFYIGKSRIVDCD
ncbi:hypothetical protein LOTGIDRAFT_173200 [Lottia gigantea]|uniref:Uncharacterized protein n=1 Tax=Lottia gigantea TaxID=225164 RepID=V4A8X9_LOTGI|nr:hypothetical protein LOTGIDRAFT_173200 [Lottia gigantea]ESP00394.1 hypothetical protein LOTGIDRAFT_173200 [Lottia gigantea]